MGTASSRWAGRGGVAVGVLLAVALLAAARLPAGDGHLGLDLTVGITPTGELGIGSAGPILTGTGMEPGSNRVSGVTELRSQAGRRLSFQVRALPSNGDVDGLLKIRVAAAGRVLYEGSLGGLRRWTRRALVLAPGEVQALAVAAWLPPGTAAGAGGRSVDVPLELRMEGGA